jgi:cytochrome c peroxidase
MKTRSGSSAVSRRDLLRGLAAGAVATAAINVPQASTPTGTTALGVTIFRLSTRNTQACRSCHIHHRYMLFISQARADRMRAHPGCNCPITKQKIGKDKFNSLFLDSKAIRDGFVDLRRIPR